MLNFLRPVFARLFNPIVRGLARTPVTPNMITVAGTVGVSAASLWLLPIGELFPGAFIATCFVFTDMLDGQLARIKGNSGKYGAFLDSTMDRFADAAIFGGITIWFMRTNHLLAVVSLFCLAAGLSVSYVKARAEGLGLNADVGLIERPERMIIGLTSIGLSGLGIPYVLPIGMWGLAAGTALTLYQRMRAVYVDAKSQAAPPTAPQPAAPTGSPPPPTAPPTPTPAAPAPPTQPTPAPPAPAAPPTQPTPAPPTQAATTPQAPPAASEPPAPPAPTDPPAPAPAPAPAPPPATEPPAPAAPSAPAAAPAAAPTEEE
jgi:CDP-diacylglycerol--glycerol-3-phosphate 3-phosphatidyltransferase